MVCATTPAAKCHTENNLALALALTLALALEWEQGGFAIKLDELIEAGKKPGYIATVKRAMEVSYLLHPS